MFDLHQRMYIVDSDWCKECVQLHYGRSLPEVISAICDARKYKVLGW